MNLRINVFGEKVQVFCNDKPLDLGVHALLLGLMTDWNLCNGAIIQLTNAELARLTASTEIDGAPDNLELDRVRHAKTIVRKKLQQALSLTFDMPLTDILGQAQTDVALFRRGIETGKAIDLEKSLLLYDSIFKSYDTRVQENAFTAARREYEGLFWNSIDVLGRLSSPCLHNVVAAKIHYIKESEGLQDLAEGLMDGYKVAMANRAAEIPLQAPDLVIERLILDAKGRPTSLGERRESFIGRENEVELVTAYLATEWIVTLTGVGGCGKTALMKVVGRHFVVNDPEAFPDGVWLVNLIPVDPNSNKEGLAKHILRELGMRLNSDTSAYTALIDYLQRKQSLLLLDNCEHLEKLVPRLIARIGENCPMVKLLATTRVAGGSRWGRQIKVLPFVPLDPEALPELDVALQNEAIRLFQDTRQKVRRDFQVSPIEIKAVAQICRLLSGIPLAIKLVACKNGNLEDIARSLETHWKSIPEELEDAEERHETMSHCILWSYDRLQEEEKALFRRLALFTGGWTHAMCREVCAMRGLDREHILDALNRLCESSMVVFDNEIDRYYFLEPVRAFAQEELENSGEKEEVLERLENWLTPVIHIEDFRDIGSVDRDKVSRALEETSTAEKFILEQAKNFAEASKAETIVSEQAKNSAFRAFDVELHSVVYRYAEGAFRIARKRLNIFAKLASMAPPDKQMRYHLAMGAVTFLEANYEESIKHCEKGMEVAKILSSQHYIGMAYSAIGINKAFLNLPDAESQVHLGCEVAQKTKEDWAIAFSQMCQGAWQWQSGQLDQATASYEVALDRFQACQDKIMSALVLNSLAHLVCRKGETARAAGYYLESLAQSVEGKFKNARGIAGCVMGSCGIAVQLKQYELAAQFWGAGQTHYTRLGACLIPPIQSDYDREIARVKEELGNRFMQPYNNGKQLSLTEAARQAQDFLQSVHTK